MQLKNLLLAVLLATSFVANGTVIFSTGINVNPTTPSVNDFITADVFATFPTSGYTLQNTPTFYVLGNQLIVDVSFNSPTGIVLQVFDTIIHTVNVGFLNTGNYMITANYYVDGAFSDQVSSSFSVAAVPLPSSILLVVIGFGALLFHKARIRKSHEWVFPMMDGASPCGHAPYDDALIVGRNHGRVPPEGNLL